MDAMMEEIEQQGKQKACKKASLSLRERLSGHRLGKSEEDMQEDEVENVPSSKTIFPSRTFVHTIWMSARFH
jgi:hypothetical protein